MTAEQAEQILRDTGADSDDIETYVYGPDNPSDYFSKIADTAELLSDFEAFQNNG